MARGTWSNPVGALGGGKPSEGTFRSAIPSSYYSVPDDGGALSYGWGSKALQNATPLGLGYYSWNPSSGGIFAPETFQSSDTGNKVLDFLSGAEQIQKRNKSMVGDATTSDIKAGTPGAGISHLGDDIAIMWPGQTPQQQQPSRFAGAMSGAMAGAQLGSIVPGLGTGVGAALGGLGGFLFG